MKTFQAFFKKISSKIEDNPIPLVRYFSLFVALLSIRLCLEFFANHRLFKIDDVIHIGLWFVFIVLAFILQIQYYSKVPMEKVVKLVICCFSIALSAPIIDLIISQGKFSKMNYLTINSSTDFIKAYFTIGGASLTRGATIGIRIEIILLVFASFNYILIRSNNLWRALMGTFSIYTVLFLTGIIPFFIGQINSFFQLTYAEDDQSSIYLLFTLDLLLMLLLLLKLKSNQHTFKITLNSIFNFCSILIPFLFGVYFARTNYPDNWTLNPTTIYFLPLLIVLLLGLSIFQISRKNDSLLTSEFDKKMILLILLFTISVCISFYTVFAVFLIWSINFLLYEKPSEFYKSLFFSTVLKAFLTLGYCFLGFMTFGAPMVGFNKIYIYFILIVSFIVFFGFSKIKDYFS